MRRFSLVLNANSMHACISETRGASKIALVFVFPISACEYRNLRVLGVFVAYDLLGPVQPPRASFESLPGRIKGWCYFVNEVMWTDRLDGLVCNEGAFLRLDKFDLVCFYLIFSM